MLSAGSRKLRNGVREDDERRGGEAENVEDEATACVSGVASSSGHDGCVTSESARLLDASGSGSGPLSSLADSDKAASLVDHQDTSGLKKTVTHSARDSSSFIAANISCALCFPPKLIFAHTFSISSTVSIPAGKFNALN
jgi:hypothetical protein